MLPREGGGPAADARMGRDFPPLFRLLTRKEGVSAEALGRCWRSGNLGAWGAETTHPLREPRGVIVGGGGPACRERGTVSGEGGNAGVGRRGLQIARWLGWGERGKEGGARSGGAPEARREKATMELHGESWVDWYSWMHDVASPRIRRHLQHERAYLRALMRTRAGGGRTMGEWQREVVGEMEESMPPPSHGPPEPCGPWLYGARVPDGQELPVLFRWPAAMHTGEGAHTAESDGGGWQGGRGEGRADRMGEQMGQQGVAGEQRAEEGGVEERGEQVLADLNELADYYGYVRLVECKVSRCHALLALLLDLSPSESPTLFLLHLPSSPPSLHSRPLSSHVRPSKPLIHSPPFAARLLCTPIPAVATVDWAADSQHVLYTKLDANLRSHRVMRRRIHIPQEGEGEILEEGEEGEEDEEGEEEEEVLRSEEEGVVVAVSRTKDWRYLTLNLNTRSSSEVHLLDAQHPTAPPRLLQRRREGEQWFVEHHGGWLYALSTLDFLPLSLTLTSTPFPPLPACALLPSSAHITRHSVAIRSLAIRVNGWDIQPSDIVISDIEMPEAVCEVHMPSGTLSVLHQEPYCRHQPHQQQHQEQPANQKHERVEKQQKQQQPQQEHSPPTPRLHPPSPPLPLPLFCVPGLICQRLWVPSPDGPPIPLTLIHHASRQRDSEGAALLEGYGAYGEVMAAEWVPHRLPLLHRGWVIALAHTRGGGELGRAWHEAGRGERKGRAVGDLRACGEYLVGEGWAGRGRVAARGSSAGGFLVAAAVNADPGLFRAIVLDVPFLDALTSMSNPALPLTALDRHEWGDPLACPSAFRALRALCPVLNVQQGVKYPAALLSAALHDSRVGPWEALKWAAKVRAESDYSERERPVVVRVWGDRGHVAPCSGREQLEDVALEHAFLLHHVGGGEQSL
ncbi:unnamed protein product [Closterium sp. Naga37s-1]|nr:unnamed protein product [Closterium sp. Naga37s-1]